MTALRVASASFAALLIVSGCSVATSPVAPAKVALTPCHVANIEEEVRCGVLPVPENRERPTGRMLPLKIVVLPAHSAQPAREPVFFLTGGPGNAATNNAPQLVEFQERQTHDIVLVDARGTGEGHALNCPIPGSDGNLQLYLQPLFADVAAFRTCREELQKTADLTQYTTLHIARDLEDARRALGYEQIHLHAVSYGTRLAIAYMQLFGAHVRSAMLNGLAPLANRNPLYMPANAQQGLDVLIEECNAEAACRQAYPTIRADVDEVMRRLRQAPARVQVKHPATGAAAEVLLTDITFSDMLRTMLYAQWISTREIPALLQRAKAGDLTAFADLAVRSRAGMFRGFALGAAMSVLCSEDIPRITEEDIVRETAGTFAGDYRVRSNIAACAEWPKAQLPATYFQDFRSNVPVVFVSGKGDPVTPPRWAEAVKAQFPNSLHLIVPGGHVPMNECIDAIRAGLFRSANIATLDTSCVAALRNDPFVTTKP
ncbi:MAG TPA: alpha/beta hydrolase [Thermoanaerobaculia bacterium]|jgi:pimeloyl-ACP methyl ester carboxylesterase